MSALDAGNPDENVPAVVYCAPCIYCRTPILTESFRPWSVSPGLLTAACHGCLRHMRVAATDLAEMARPYRAAESQSADRWV